MGCLDPSSGRPDAPKERRGRKNRTAPVPSTTLRASGMTEKSKEHRQECQCHKQGSGEVEFAGGQGVDAFEVGGEADAGSCGDLDGALGADGYFGGDDVFFP